VKRAIRLPPLFARNRSIASAAFEWPLGGPRPRSTPSPSTSAPCGYDPD
jgi:hypothetical protein